MQSLGQCLPAGVPEFRTWLIHWASCTELTGGICTLGDSLEFTYLKQQQLAPWRRPMEVQRLLGLSSCDYV